MENKKKQQDKYGEEMHQIVGVLAVGDFYWLYVYKYAWAPWYANNQRELRKIAGFKFVTVSRESRSSSY